MSPEWRASCGERSDKSTVRGCRSPAALRELWQGSSDCCLLDLTRLPAFRTVPNAWPDDQTFPENRQHYCKSKLAEAPSRFTALHKETKLVKHAQIIQWLNTPRTPRVSKPSVLWHKQGMGGLLCRQSPVQAKLNDVGRVYFGQTQTKKTSPTERISSANLAGQKQ